MNLLIGALTEGFIFVPLALGLYITYRVYDTLDLTVDGSFLVGAAASAALLFRNVPPVVATALGAMAGAFAGVITGMVHTRLRVNLPLAGVLTTTALYSVTLFIMGGGTLSLASAETLFTFTETIGPRLLRLPASLTLFDTTVSGGSLATMFAMGLLAAVLTFGLTMFLRTELGLALRAAGNCPQMARSVAVDVDHMIVLGLGVSNGVIALAGAFFAQYTGFANVQMGIGAVITGLATLMVGEALLGTRPLGRWVAGAMLGSVAFRLLIAAAIRAGLNASALKLVTALIVLLVLMLPRLLPRARRRRSWASGERHA